MKRNGNFNSVNTNNSNDDNYRLLRSTLLVSIFTGPHAEDGRDEAWGGWHRPAK